MIRPEDPSRKSNANETSVSRGAPLAGLAFLAGRPCPAAPPAAHADGLQRFTGYANAGTPSDKVLASGVIESAADAPKAFGGSIYFMVLDRGEGRGDDTWGTGVKSFDTQFQTGLDDALKPSPGLDKKARYLYLYQVVNDRGSKSPIHEVTLRLIIDPAMITSWGYFAAAKKDKEKAPVGTGVGFASRPAPASRRRSPRFPPSIPSARSNGRSSRTPRVCRRRSRTR